VLPDVPSFEVTSADLTDGTDLPQANAHPSVGGEDISPQLSWSGFPEPTQSFVVTCYDPDAPTGSGFWHWVLVNIPGSVTELATGAAGPEADGIPSGSFHIRNDYGYSAYGGAAPPAGDRPHRYVFAVHAVDLPTLPVTPDVTPAVVGFNLAFHTLARATLRVNYQVKG
jgi:Raf kinase inhibitor-like YbhB/YbcL family protein